MMRKVLIVDDSESVREAVSLTLESAGYSVVQANDGQQGLRLLQCTAKLDMVITDLNMPVMDGISLVREIRRSDIYRFIPILIFTTESQDVKRREAKEAGATGWIVKPFSSDRLIQIVQKVIR